MNGTHESDVEGEGRCGGCTVFCESTCLPCICLIADSALSRRLDEGSPKVPSKLNYPFISSLCWKEEAVQ